VDAGDIVAHIMQPASRTYYNLEELWGEGKFDETVNSTAPVARPAHPVAAVRGKPKPAARAGSGAESGAGRRRSATPAAKPRRRKPSP
jgi:ribosome-associated protein